MKPDSISSVTTSNYTQPDLSTSKPAKLSGNGSEPASNDTIPSMNYAIGNLTAAAELVLTLKRMFASQPSEAASAHTNLDPLAVAVLSS